MYTCEPTATTSLEVHEAPLCLDEGKGDTNGVANDLQSRRMQQITLDGL